YPRAVVLKPRSVVQERSALECPVAELVEQRIDGQARGGVVLEDHCGLLGPSERAGDPCPYGVDGQRRPGSVAGAYAFLVELDGASGIAVDQVAGAVVGAAM